VTKTNFANGLPPLPGNPNRNVVVKVDQPDQSDLAWTVRRLEVQVATVQAENRRLRRMTANGKVGRLLHRTAADARQLVGWRAAGYSVARRQCLTYGMSERRWAWALALLKLAGVVAMNTQYADDFLEEDLGAIESRIARAVQRVEGNGISLLVFRLPKGRSQR
jgi:hypothetical protein